MIDTNEMRNAIDSTLPEYVAGIMREAVKEIDALRERAAKAERQLKDESLQASEIFTLLRVENETLQKENAQLHEAAFGEVAGIKEPAIHTDGVRWLTRSEQDEIDALRARVAELEEFQVDVNALVHEKGEYRNEANTLRAQLNNCDKTVALQSARIRELEAAAKPEGGVRP